MAGYFTVGNGRYDGTHVANAALTNGTFVSLNGSMKWAAGTSATASFKVLEKLTLYGLPALEIVCEVPDGTIYMVENDFDPNLCAYDEATYGPAANALVKAKTPLIGEKMIVSVASAVYSAVSVGNSVVVTSGALAKAS